jgi:hypothetical protein
VLYNVSSRYTEVLLLGLSANAWFVIRATEESYSFRKEKISFLAIALIFFLGVFSSYTIRTLGDIKIMKMDYESRSAQAKNVYLYLKTKYKSILHFSGSPIPYPNAERLQGILDNPDMQVILPRQK